MNPDSIRAAYARVAGHLRRTPVLAVERGTFGLNLPLNLKLELVQHAGSFKPRGALNRMLSNAIPAGGVIAASGGNHGAAVAWAAQRLGVPAEIFVPEVASATKVERIRSFGAAIYIVGANYAEALAASSARAAESGALVVHAYDQPETISGQGTVALEWLEQSPDLDTLLIACGGGGLAAGVAAWCEGRIRVVAVEPVRCPTLSEALRAGRPVDVEVGGVAVDSLGARRIGELAFGIAREFIAETVLVDDEAIRKAQHLLWRELRIATEPGGATALAALSAGAYVPHQNERLGVLICGGNVDLQTLT